MPNPIRRHLYPLHGARASARIFPPLLPLLAIAIAIAITACGKKPSATPPAVPPAQASLTNQALPPVARQLAAARLDAATTRLGSNHRDEALALAVAALKLDPACTGAATLVQRILTETTWNFPVATLNHPWPVEQLAFAPPASLWVSVAENQPDGFNTTVLWNTDSLQLDSVLFPARGAATHQLVVGPNPHAIVIQRGSGPDAVTLLCDAKSLRPLCDLGPLPDGLTPQAVIASSANGLLIAHPGPASATDARLVWRIRDAATGGIVRSSEPADPATRPLAAQLDASRLRVVLADGSLLDLPVSPVEPARTSPPAAPLALLQAQLQPDGGSLLALLDRGPDLAPVRRIYQINNPPEDAAPRVEAAVSNNTDAVAVPGWVTCLPWSREPSVWTGLLRDHGNPAEPSPIEVAGNHMRFCGSAFAPIHSAAPITAAAFGPNLAIIGTAAGGVVMHHFLPLPVAVEAPAPGDPDLTAMGVLAEVLCGLRFDDATGTCITLTAGQRLDLLDKLPPERAAGVVPGLSFAATLADLKAIVPREAAAASLLPMWDRLARSDGSAKAWPRLLELAQPLADSRWHQDLTEAAALRAQDPASAQPAADDPSPWLAQRRIREAFGKRDEAAILKEIEAAGGRGPAAATALALALAADSADWIDACLKSATGLPPLLRVLVESRLAWLQHRTVDAITPWPDEFPDFTRTRLTEDWDGWEQEDFAPCYAAHIALLQQELASYELAADATPEARAALTARLLDPAARGILGRRRLADDCLKAALAMAAFPEDSNASFQLANRARTLGAQPEPCLRAEALALTQLGDYKNAHPRWVTLLTEHPVATHLSNDYAEAAYTAFENGDPNQAVEILTTGVRRFPNDANYALRAGWIALLTGNGGRAYQFLLAGLRIGFPDDKLENATLLLAVAAAQAGFPEDAATHYQNLLDIAPAWADIATIDALDWPDELKACLFALAQ